MPFSAILRLDEDWRDDMPEMKSFDAMVRDATEQFAQMFPGEELALVNKDAYTETVLARMWADAGELTKLRKGVLCLTETKAPKAYAYARTVVGHGMDRRIQKTQYPSVTNASLPNGAHVTFTQLKIGPVRPDGRPAWEYCMLFNVDDYQSVLEQLSQFKEKAQARRPRRESAPDFEKIMSGGFWDKVMKVKMRPDGAIDYGSTAMTNAQYAKFRELRKQGVIRFDKDGNVIIKESLLFAVPSFADYLSLFGS
jgi:hypothetical protein